MGHPRYTQVCAAIDELATMPKGQPALDRVRAAFVRERISFPEGGARTIAVAGTNGKGSVSRMLDTLLRASGARTGLYTSPHLVTMRERIRVGGESVSEAELVALYERAEATIGALSLTHFEALTLMAALAFHAGNAPVDWAIYEVGMGGRWDPTNAVPHAAAAITALGMDHQKFLGDTIEAIAGEKFGIVASGNAVVHAPFPNASVAALAEAREAATGLRWREAAKVGFRVVQEKSGPRFFASTPWGEAELSLPGKRGAENAAVALTLLDSLGIAPQPLLPALAKIDWPGRMQRVATRVSRAPVFLSGDHNPQGAASLVELLAHYPRRTLHLLVGIAATKDGEAMLGEFARVPGAKIYLTSPSYKRRALGSYSAGARILAAGAWDDAWTALAEIGEAAEPEDMIVVTGSLYLVGEILARLAGERG